MIQLKALRDAELFILQKKEMTIYLHPANGGLAQLARVFRRNAERS
jgi:hypothetical protein